MGWTAIADKLDGRPTTPIAILTADGTWGVGETQYPSQVAQACIARNPDLFYEVNCPYPATFGFVGGAPMSDSYQQSVLSGIGWYGQWLHDNPNTPFILGGYSQGGELVSRVAMEVMDGLLVKYSKNFLGGYTFGNPSRGNGFVAPGVVDPGGHGISTTLMTKLPTRNGQVIWADYVHSKANGDAADDMYPFVHDPGATDMTDVYTMATALQINDPVAFVKDMVNDLFKAVEDVLRDPANILSALGQGLMFVAAPGGPTAPHISYAGEIGGYANLVAPAVDFVYNLARN